MAEEIQFDIACIGGGLAGLCASILAAKKGYRVIVYEKESYPFQKVCGEYISRESWNFINEDIGIDLLQEEISEIKKLVVSAPSGNTFTCELDPGGFGISRFRLDNLLRNHALLHDVTVADGTKVLDITYANNGFQISSSRGKSTAKLCCGTWGKRSNIDVKWNRRFLLKKSSRLNNFVGIKYHVTSALPEDTISLHNFKDGYCGFSKVEKNKYCLCWFSKVSNLKAANNSVAETEEKILSANPELKKLFAGIVKINDTPVAVSQVSLSKKTAVENHVLMLGDASGMISPLCGNGMSIAMHSAKLAAFETDKYLRGSITRTQMEKNFILLRKKKFGERIFVGRLLQFLFGREHVMNLTVYLMKRNKSFARRIVAMTHGKEF